jgi:hypothetical protein
MWVYNLPEDEQKKLRKGKENGIMVFNKSRRRMKTAHPGRREESHDE